MATKPQNAAPTPAHTADPTSPPPGGGRWRWDGAAWQRNEPQEQGAEQAPAVEVADKQDATTEG
jgi:hypothetical protein